MTTDRPLYVVVEGVIGVGKTTLVQRLAQRHAARTVLEVFAENPFLESFYREPTRYAFPTEMFFLLDRFRQQELFAQEDLLRAWAVSDYLFEKCRIFAGLTLDEHELALFDRVYAALSRQVPTPDVVVWLRAPVPVLQERIAARGRTFEAPIAPSYLEQLDDAYATFFSRWTACPVLAVDTTTLDLREDAPFEAVYRDLVEAARDARHSRQRIPQRLDSPTSDDTTLPSAER
jgi:deoxyguanosine kinase